jgi:hypothetical protein
VLSNFNLIFLLVIYIQLFAVQHSVGSDLAFYSVGHYTIDNQVTSEVPQIAIMNGASAFGRVAGNWAADVYGPFNVQVCRTV